MQLKYDYLFNFAVSYTGGGLKRLQAYAKWFNENGGAMFIIHPHCESLINEFSNNRFFLVNQTRYERIYNDCKYLENIQKEIGKPRLYYSYGIPVYARFGEVNWFHLSNVLPLYSRAIPLSLVDRFFRLPMLGWKIKTNYKNTDIISAESNFSLGLIDVSEVGKLCLSVNGSDEELSCLKTDGTQEKEHIATIVGTHKYKAVKDSYRVFEMLRQRDDRLKFIIIGDEKALPKDLRVHKNVTIKGLLKRREVIECLRKTKYYISTTCIENSWNAASEGVLFADESYISDIGPHRDLLMGVPFEHVLVPGVVRPVMHVKNGRMSAVNLKTWEQIIVDLIATVDGKQATS